jgi:hypothetical protein
MKTKKFGSKLKLNKNTISNLNVDEKNNVRGGKLPTACTYCLYTCTGSPCFGHETDEFRTCPTCYGFTDSCPW